MSIFIATAPVDPAANEIRGFARATQEEAEAIAAANSRTNAAWVVYELLECARAVVDAPRVVRTREPVAVDPQVQR